MTTIGEIIFRKGKGGLTTFVAAVMGRTVSSLHGTDDKTIKIYPLKMHPWKVHFFYPKLQ